MLYALTTSLAVKSSVKVKKVWKGFLHVLLQINEADLRRDFLYCNLGFMCLFVSCLCKERSSHDVSLLVQNFAQCKGSDNTSLEIEFSATLQHFI